MRDCVHLIQMLSRSLHSDPVIRTVRVIDPILGRNYPHVYILGHMKSERVEGRDKESESGHGTDV